MEQDGSEKRIADLEHQLDAQKHDADLQSSRLDPETVYPSQTPGYGRSGRIPFLRNLAIVSALFAGGPIVMVVGHGARLTDVVWLGVVLVLLGVLLPVCWMIGYIGEAKKEQALRNRGTVELLTVDSSFLESKDSGSGSSWRLRSELQIRLDGGPTFRGTYRTSVSEGKLRAWGPLDAWFRVGASLRCLYNPTNPDKVLIFPQAGRDDEVTYNKLFNTEPDNVWFFSAT
jgi:hypothetical protein